MREIKFRVWNGVLHEYRTIDMNSGKQNLGMGFESAEGIGSNTTTIYHSFGDVIEQFTGMTDVNGKDIYEGDIVSVDVQDYPAGYARETIFVGVIVFEESTCGFCVKLLKRPKFNGEEFPSEICGLPVSGWDDYEYDYFWFDESVNDEDIEVVGNTHENPELLEDD